MTNSMKGPQGYLPRVVDAQVEHYLKVFGAVEIAGTKWCGKTWTALEHSASVSYVDEAVAAAEADPSLYWAIPLIRSTSGSGSPRYGMP